MMRVFIVFCLLIYLPNASPVRSSQGTVSNGGNIKSIPAVEALVYKLEGERWKDEDEQCLRKTLNMLKGVINNTLWATWVWDSMQPPVGTFYGTTYHIGNYEQCLQAPWSSTHPDLRTQYCIVDVKSKAVEEAKELNVFDRADEYFHTPSKDGRYFNKQFFGVCLPAVCGPSAVANITKQMLQLTHLPVSEVFVDDRDCQRAGEDVEYSMGYYVFWTLVGMLFATVAVSTFFNSEGPKHSSLDIIKKSFCLRRNFNALFKVNKDEIKVMNGMRFISAALVVLLHNGFYKLFCPIVNGLDVDKVSMHTRLGQTMSHMDVVVDTFFAMSGLLLIRGLVLGKQKNLVGTLVKRYIRLIGPLMMSTFFVTSAVMYMGDGPFWMKATRTEVEMCTQNWWKNVLLVNNDVETLCHIVSWYVSCDFQLAIMTTFVYWIFRRNRKLGVTAFGVVSLAVTLYLGAVVYWMELDIIPFDGKVYFDFWNDTVLNYVYLKSYSRAGPYLVGVLMGYIVATYPPRGYQNLLSKKWSVVTTVVSLATMSIVVTIGAIFLGRPYDPLEAAVVVATNRVFWAVGVCCIIGACEYGSVPLVSDFLSWPGFVPLSKLSYGLYLLHPFVLQIKMYAARSAETYGIFLMISNSLGDTIIGCAASFIMFLILEAPLINISSKLFTEKPKSCETSIMDKSIFTNGNSVVPHQNGQTKEKIS